MLNLCGTIFYIKTNVLQDFRICMSVPLISLVPNLNTSNVVIVYLEQGNVCQFKEKYKTVDATNSPSTCVFNYQRDHFTKTFIVTFKENQAQITTAG